MLPLDRAVLAASALPRGHHQLVQKSRGSLYQSTTSPGRQSPHHSLLFLIRRQSVSCHIALHLACFTHLHYFFFFPFTLLSMVPNTVRLRLDENPSHCWQCRSIDWEELLCGSSPSLVFRACALLALLSHPFSTSLVCLSPASSLPAVQLTKPPSSLTTWHLALHQLPWPPAS